MFRELKKRRDDYIKKLNGIYENNLDKVLFFSEAEIFETMGAQTENYYKIGENL